ncbi:MAG: 30S ribosomal protein S4e [Candidatus Micrarchaeota archaeon]
MARKGMVKHLKRIASTVFRGLPRKGAKWLKRTIPGKHAAKEAITLSELLTEKLKLVENSKQAKKILHDSNVLIDGIPVKNAKTPVGLMDVVSLPKLGKHYRVSTKKGAIALIEIKPEETKTKYCKIIGKTTTKKGKIQLNLHDSRNYLIEKEEDNFKVGDTLVLSIPKQELKTTIKLSKGVLCLIYKGKNSGTMGKLEEVLERKGGTEDNVKVKTSEGEQITLKSYLFAIDEKFKSE